MKLELAVLGSGAFSPAGARAPERVRNPAGYALARGREVLLFDLGFGNVRQIFRAGLDPSDVSHVFLTHRHPDHVGDLPALLFHFRYSAPPRSRRVALHGPRGFKGFYGRLCRAHYPWLQARGYQISAAELEEGGVVRGKGWSVRAREVPHSTEALAYRFESREGSVCYTGDTGFDPGLAAFGRGADLFIVECSLPDRGRYSHHLRASDALRILEASGAKRGLLSHLSEESARDLAGRELGPGVALAEDLLRIVI